jgi:hypothetical protein
MTTLPDLEPAGLDAAYAEYKEVIGDIDAGDRLVIRRSIAAYLSAARSTVPEAGKAVVKLQWETHLGSYPNTTAFAPAIGNKYCIISRAREAIQGEWNVRFMREERCLSLAGFATEDEAKEFAQKHFERTILSALTSVPAPSGAEEQRTIACDEDNMPERIWAGDFDESGFGHCVAGMQGGLYAEYIRADLIAPQAAEDIAVERLAVLLKALAVDCEETDGWEGAAPDLREAAAALTSLSAERDEAMARLAVEVKGSSEAYKLYLASEAEATSLRRKLEEAREALRVIATGSGYEWSETREQLHRIIDAAVECANSALRTLSVATPLPEDTHHGQ